MENTEKQASCSEHERCLHLLQLVLDGEASGTEKDYYMHHIEECMPCYRSYNIETEIRNILRSKLEKKNVPLDLVSSIRSKVKETV
jgi:anti-sigma factor (TIGR02949 family)